MYAVGNEETPRDQEIFLGGRRRIEWRGGKKMDAKSSDHRMHVRICRVTLANGLSFRSDKQHTLDESW